ncbi:MAG: hypothetical protein IPI51_06780 [Betaproteobacteria bacterium]|jgi:predicted DNA-binding transcriptional regulator AlpA|nr:hypothetical protein [Betaproteobacteria bacterium]MBK7515309.1 hypothetical protein [Betaproteobacteria bacterium]
MEPKFAKKSDLIRRPGGGRSRYPWSATTLWRRVKEGRFPPPVNVGGILCWPVDVLDRWDAEQLSGSAE